ncbi:hypothetical protein AHF37_04689 [Paragonimus kellicotti]|nr:hypothetical protein AHF37_04689 [Paragonimus kellicotti]
MAEQCAIPNNCEPRYVRAWKCQVSVGELYRWILAKLSDKDIKRALHKYRDLMPRQSDWNRKLTQATSMPELGFRYLYRCGQIDESNHRTMQKMLKYIDRQDVLPYFDTILYNTNHANCSLKELKKDRVNVFLQLSSNLTEDEVHPEPPYEIQQCQPMDALRMTRLRRIQTDRQDLFEQQIHRFVQASNLLLSQPPGEFVCHLRFNQLSHLEAFWSDYQSGLLKKLLALVGINPLLTSTLSLPLTLHLPHPVPPRGRPPLGQYRFQNPVVPIHNVHVRPENINRPPVVGHDLGPGQPNFRPLGGNMVPPGVVPNQFPPIAAALPPHLPQSTNNSLQLKQIVLSAGGVSITASPHDSLIQYYCSIKLRVMVDLGPSTEALILLDMLMAPSTRSFIGQPPENSSASSVGDVQPSYRGVQLPMVLPPWMHAPPFVPNAAAVEAVQPPNPWFLPRAAAVMPAVRGGWSDPPVPNVLAPGSPPARPSGVKNTDETPLIRVLADVIAKIRIREPGFHRVPPKFDLNLFVSRREYENGRYLLMRNLRSIPSLSRLVAASNILSTPASMEHMHSPAGATTSASCSDGPTSSSTMVGNQASAPSAAVA